MSFKDADGADAVGDEEVVAAGDGGGGGVEVEGCRGRV